MKNNIKGTWQIIQWCPDLATREWVNIGVGFNDGQSYSFKYITKIEKINMIYGDGMGDHLNAVISLVIGFFSKNIFDFSPQIKLIEVGFSQGATINEILDRLFDRIVTFG